MKNKKYLLIAIFILVLIIRLNYAFKSPYLDNDSYYDLRQIESIRNNGFPLINDELSYSGRISISLPMFYYLMALFPIMPKILPNVLASLMVIIVFYISFEITKDENASLFSAFMSGFIPIYMNVTLNNVSSYALAIPLLFLDIYFLMKIHYDKNYFKHFIITTFLLILTHASVMILIIGLLFYLFLTRIEGLKQSNAEIEVIIFSIFFVLWFFFIYFKKSLLTNGFNIIWQNIPAQILSQYFSSTTILLAFYTMGFMPLVFGSYIIYKNIFSFQNKNIHLLTGFVLSITILLWTKSIQPKFGLIYLGIILTILFSKFYSIALNYITKTRLPNVKYGVIFIFFALFFFTSFQASLVFANTSNQRLITDDEIRAFKWLEKTPDNSVILGSLNEGHFITYFGQRKNVLDNNFLLIEHPDLILEDIDKIYLTPYQTDAISLLNKYDVDYILLSEKTKTKYKIDNLKYTQNTECFKQRYYGNTKIYEVMCKIEEVK